MWLCCLWPLMKSHFQSLKQTSFIWGKWSCTSKLRQTAHWEWLQYKSSSGVILKVDLIMQERWWLPERIMGNSSKMAHHSLIYKPTHREETQVYLHWPRRAISHSSVTHTHTHINCAFLILYNLIMLLLLQLYWTASAIQYHNQILWFPHHTAATICNEPGLGLVQNWVRTG